MTVAIAFALSDGAILMTDRRRTNLETNEIHTDTAVKIHRLTPTLSAASFGIETWTRLTLEVLQKAARPSWTPPEFVSCIDALLPQAFECLAEDQPVPLSLNEPDLITGLVLAGHFQKLPFISRILYAGTKRVTKEIATTPGQGILVGGHSCNGDEILMRHIQSEPALQKSLREGLGASIREVTAIKNCMAQTVFEIATHESTVGGNAAYAIIRRNAPTKYGEVKAVDISHYETHQGRP